VINEKFAEAREEIEYAREDAETVSGLQLQQQQGLVGACPAHCMALYLAGLGWECGIQIKHAGRAYPAQP
jgi:hypothetical protein